MTNSQNGTLYVGVTSDLVQRVLEHKNGVVDGFTKRHGLDRLVWYELHGTMDSAINREKALKRWKRQWKISLIEEANSLWMDLYEELQ